MATEGDTYQGPWLSMAFFCEKVLQEVDGVCTYVRVVDRVHRVVEGPNPPETMPRLEGHELYFVVGLKSGGARGRSTITVDWEGPDGIVRPGLSQSVVFEAEDRGTNWVTRMSLTLEWEGVYWFNIRLDDRLLTRVPLRVIYDRRVRP